METKWLEDFVALAQTRNFSKAANMRCVTQPAFSRRIQSLEAWLGCELIDRSAYPTRLSNQGEVFYEQALEMLERIRETRTLLQGGVSNTRQVIRLVVPHTLAYSMTPFWVRNLRDALKTQHPEVSFQLTAKNIHDAVLHFTDGACDFLVCYHHSREPIDLDSSKFEVKLLGVEEFKPFSLPGPDGKPLYTLDALAPLAVPVLTYSRHAYLSRMTDLALEQGPRFLKKSLFETDMSESLKAMCESGLGVAWLPSSAVASDVQSRLVPLDGPYKIEMEMRLFRRIPRGKEHNQMADLLDQTWRSWPD